MLLLVLILNSLKVLNPTPFPLIPSLDEIDKLKEPADYLSSPIIQKKLNTLKELKKLCPETPDFIGHLLEGPITTAVLIQWFP